MAGGTADGLTPPLLLPFGSIRSKWLPPTWWSSATAGKSITSRAALGCGEKASVEEECGEKISTGEEIPSAFAFGVVSPPA